MESLVSLLFELLVVIAIIALLVSILLPSLRKAKEFARRVICASNVRNLGLAVTQYHYENNDWMPKLLAEGAFSSPGGGRPYTNYCVELSLYLGCEGDPWLPYAWEPQDGQDGAPGIFTCPSERKDLGNRILAYGWHWSSFGAYYDGLVSHYWSRRRKVSDVERPSEKSCLGESRPLPGIWAASYASGFSTTSYWGGYWWGTHDYYIGRRHNDGANYLCVDGHVEYAKFDDLVKDWEGKKRIFSRD